MTTAKPLKSISLKLMTADEIKNLSDGEVTSDAAMDELGNPVPGGLFCPSIFGEQGRGLGHIDLAYPVAHPWFEDVIRLLLDRDDVSDGRVAKESLNALDLDRRLESLTRKAKDGPSFALKCACALKESDTPLDALLIETLAVVPPVTRPMISTSGGALSSDLNELYRRVISRNNALKEFLSRTEGQVVGVYVRDAVQRLTTSVRSLIGGRRNDGALQSLTDLIASPNGFLKRNLEGKRLDYSGRSVIISGAGLNMSQCGFPREMALDMFKPFIARKLIENGAAGDVTEALDMIASAGDSREVRRALQQVASEKLILLNRAPTLNRLGIQPFEPIISDDRAIALHPLVCFAFNADFDGDQMAAHLPISDCAQSEVRELLDSAVNLVSPGNGRPIAAPVQDMTLGLWFLTADPIEGGSRDYSSADAVVSDLEAGRLDIRSRVILTDKSFTGGDPVETTAGRTLFNAHLPEELRFVNRQSDRRDQEDLVAQCLERCGRERTRRMLDDLNRLGFQWVTRCSPSYGLGTAPDPKPVDEIRSRAMEEERKLRKEMASQQDYAKRLTELWRDAAVRADEMVMAEMAGGGAGSNPLTAMVASGARGNVRSLGQTFGICGPTWRNPTESDPRDSFEAPLESGFWKGFTPLGHFARTVGAREGLADTALRINLSTGLMRELIYLEQEITVTSEDCGTDDGVEVSPILLNGKVIEPLARRVRGRVAAEDVKGKSGHLIIEAGRMISKAAAETIESEGIESVKIRSALTCRESPGVCAKCYGEDPAYGRMVEKGTAVGVIAAQAVSDPVVQLTARTFYGPWPDRTGHPGGLMQMVDLLAGKSPELNPKELIQRFQQILGYQGVEVNDKHFELLARKMYDFTKIIDPGDTNLLRGDIVRTGTFKSENEKTQSKGGRPAEGEPDVLGIRDAAGKSHSVIASAAVGDSAPTLALAAASGAKDDLTGALERIVAGLAPKAGS